MGNQVDRNMDHPSEEQQQQQQRMQQHIQQRMQQHIQQHRQHIQRIQQQLQRQRRPADQRRPRSNGQQRSSSARAATNANGRNRRATNTAPRPRVARTSGASSASSSATEGRGTSGMSNHNNNSDASTRHVGGGSRHSRTSTLRSSTAPPPMPLPEVEDVEVDVVGDALPHPPSSLGPSSSSSSRGVKRPLFDGEHVSAPPHSRHRIATTEEPQREIAGPSSVAASVSEDASRGIASLAERPSTSTAAFTTSSSGLSGPSSSSSSSSSSATTSRRPFPSLFSDAPYNIPHSISDSDDSGEDNDDERQQMRTTALVVSNDPRREDADGILGADTTVEVADVVASLPGTSNAESPVGADEVQVVGFQTAVIDVEEEDENRPQIIRSTNSQPIVISDDEDDDEVEFIASSSTDRSRDRSQNDSSVMFIRESPRRPESNADDLPTTSGSAPLPAAPIPSSPISANPPTSVSSPSRSFPLGSGNVAEAGDLPPGGLTRPDHYDSPASGPSNLRPYDYPPLPRQRQSDSTSGYGGCVLPPPPPPPQPFSPRPTQPIASTSTSSSSGRDYGFVNLVGASTSYGHSSHSSSQSRPAASTSTFDGISGNTATTRATTSARPSSSFFPWDPPPFHDPTTHDPVDVFSSATSRFQCRCNPPSTRHTDDRDCMTDQVFGGRSAHSAGGMQMSRPAFTSAGTSRSASRAVTAASSGTTPTLPPSQAVSDAPRPPPPVAAAATPVAAPVAGPSVGGPSTASAPTSQDGISCPVCMDSLSEIKSEGKQVVSTNCGHVFCSQCIKDAVRTQKRCPTCRKKLSARQYHVLYL